MWDVTHSTTIPQNFPQSSDLTGRSALVTGASRGIGEAIATELARRGASVVITSRKAEPLEEAAGRIRTAVPGATVSACAGNTGDADDRTAAVAAAVAQGGGIHILVNNTGIAPLAGPLMGADLAAYRKTFDTNVVAALGFVGCAAPGLRPIDPGTDRNCPVRNNEKIPPINAKGTFTMIKND